MLCFPVLGRTLEARVQSPALAAWLRDRWSFPDRHAEPSAFRVLVEECDEPDRSPGTARGRVALHRLQLEVEEGEGFWRFGTESAGVVLRPHSGGSRISVWGVGDPARDAVVYAALFLSICDAIRTSGLLPIHAAVAVRDGTATALVGRSGVGKSTTLCRLVEAGWAPLAEDFGWLDPGTLLIHGWDRGARLRPDALRFLAAAPPVSELPRGEDGKIFLSFDRLGGCAGAAPLRTLVLLTRDDASADPRPVTSAEAVRAWWEAVGVPLASASRARVAAEIAALVRRVDVARCRVGSTEFPNPRAIAETTPIA